MFDVARVRSSGPLVGLLAPFAESLVRQGYRDNSVAFLVRLLGLLSRWMEGECLDASRLDWAMLDRFVAYCRGLGRKQPASRLGVAPLARFLVESDTATPSQFAEQGPQEGSAQAVARAFADYMVEARGITASTAAKYSWFAVRFLREHEEQGRVSWLGVDVRAVHEYVSGLSFRSASSVELMATVLRALLRFAFLEGWLGEDLSVRLGMVASRRPVPLVEGLAPADVERLIASIDPGARIGSRDRAVVILLARLGLRAGEVAKLSLDDVDWMAGKLLVRGPKGGRDLSVPLPADVGQALVCYLRVRQARAGERALFLREHAPSGPLSRQGISQIVADRAMAAGLGLVHAHRLRHAAAQAVIARGGDLVEAGQLLGHALISTTAIYAKTDDVSLRHLALEWPEVGDE